MFVLDSLLLGGLKFVLGKIASAVEAELDDETSLREELLAVQMKRELGEITEEEFTSLERALLDGIREVRARRRGEDEPDTALKVTGIEADVWTGHDVEEDETGPSGR
jgi:gas vesicle protein GvpG